MAQERWDVVLEVLDGPMAAMGEQTLRGPVIRLGSNPGPGGFKFNGYRGLDARHAVISAYAEGEATIAPVGSNQVRMAPHPHVRWKDIDPMPGPEYLSEGCAIHLGPVGRGATFQFHKIERLGVWQQGQLASEVALPDGPAGPQQAEAIRGVGSDVQSNQPHAAAVNAPPAAIDARKVRRVGTGNAKVAAGLGCLTVFTLSCAASILAGVYIDQRDIEALGPKDEGEAYYEFARVDPTAKVNPVLYSGMEQAFAEFVMEPNGEVAGRRFKDSEKWDRRLYDFTVAAVDMHLKSWAVFRRLDDVRDQYATVLKALRREGLPDAIAAVPYLESRYRAEEQSGACAKGYWQWMPESGPRFSAAGLQFRVAECKFRDADDPSYRWSPTAKTPPNMVFKRADYIDKNEAVSPYDPKKCRIPKSRGCKYDSRTNLELSTEAAVMAIGEAFKDPTLRKSGAAVQIAIGSHHTGYDDSTLGVRKKFNMLPAFQDWSSDKDRSEHHTFYGANILCDDPKKAKGWCGSKLTPHTQHYAYTAIAQHVLAACYYGYNYGSTAEFKDYARYARGDGYCVKLGIPTSEEVRSRGKGN